VRSNIRDRVVMAKGETMTINLRVDAGARVVEVRPDEPIDLGVAKEMLRKAVEASRVLPRASVLLDVRGHARLGAGALWLLAAALTENASAFTQRTALLTTPDHLAQGRFFALSAGNRGFNVEAFDEYEAALAWLTGDARAH
jgi:hypothetical protein